MMHIALAAADEAAALGEVPVGAVVYRRRPEMDDVTPATAHQVAPDGRPRSLLELLREPANALAPANRHRTVNRPQFGDGQLPFVCSVTPRQPHLVFRPGAGDRCGGGGTPYDAAAASRPNGCLAGNHAGFFGVEIAAIAHNRREIDRDPVAHAELLAVREAAACLADWRLTDWSVAVTLEPCPMCAGMLINARVGRLVYAAADPKAGAVHSLFAIATDPRLNHRVDVIHGVLGGLASAQLRTFFRGRRRQAQRQRQRQRRGDHQAGG